MLFLTLWLVVLISEKSMASKRSVNLALETVLQFEKADDINLISKVKDFLSHIQVLLNNKTQISDNVATRRKKTYKFTDFVEDLITTVNSFEDNDLKQFFRIVDKDFRSRTVDNDLIDDNVKRFISRKLTGIKNQPSTNIRRDLDRILGELRDGKNKKSSFFLDFMNSLYKRDSERKFSKLIKRLNLFLRSARKSKVVLKSIVEKVVNDVIFEHYNNLGDGEKGYIKKFVRAYIVNDDKATADNQKIKQRAKETHITQESESGNESEPASDSKAKQVTKFHFTPKTFKDVPNETTKKKLTHITLYPKSIRLKKISTGLPTLEIIENTPPSEENIKDRSKEKEIKETNKIFTNQSVEIKVNLFLNHGSDSLNREDSTTVESFKFKSSPKVFQRALKKSKKNKKYGKSHVSVRSIETFGNLYRSKTPKWYNSKEISRFVTYNINTTKEDPTTSIRRFESTYVDDNIVKEKSVNEKKYFNIDSRRFNKPTNENKQQMNEEKVPKSDIKDTVATTKRQLRQFRTKALVPPFTSSDKFETPVVTTVKSTTKTTQNVVLNEIFGDENLTHFKEVTEKPLTKGMRTKIEFVQKNNTTPFLNDSKNNINNMTTVRESEASFAFNISNYIKNSEALNIDDQEKKKQIEARMKADLGSLLGPPPTNATTGFTDIFKELEDAFDI